MIAKQISLSSAGEISSSSSASGASLSGDSVSDSDSSLGLVTTVLGMGCGWPGLGPCGSSGRCVSFRIISLKHS